MSKSKIKNFRQRDPRTLVIKEVASDVAANGHIILMQKGAIERAENGKLGRRGEEG